ncbi:MAG: ice-binding family protein [Chthoniobacteraceae bacterium]
MKRIPLSLTVAIATSLSSPLYAQVNLGAAESFGVLGGSTVTNTGTSTVSGDVGVSPGSAITGFPPGTVVNGTTHANDAVAIQAHADAITAYNTIVAMTATTILTGQDLGGLTLTPGVYYFATSAQLTGTLILDALGDSGASFYFQIGTTLTTAANSSVVLVNGANGANVYWAVGTSATLGTDTSFAGTIIADQSITLTTGASITDGRALAINGAVTLDTNDISIPTDTGSFWKGAVNNLWSAANWSTTTAGSDNVNLAGAANVVFSVTGVTPANQNTVLDYDATIASLTVNDTAAVTISGTNTLTISGTTAPTGITINAGAGLTTIATNVVLAGASQTVTVDNAAGLLISGTIGGSIGLTKSGTGQLTITANETYTGPTLITSGTLQLGDGSTAGSSIASSSSVTIDGTTGVPTLAINLANGETFTNDVVDNGLVTTIASGTNIISGVISGTGSLQQNGTGVTVLSGANTYTGSTQINDGTLQVDGSITSNVLVTGGTLDGTGTVYGNVGVASGAVSPGNDSNQGGTLNVTGNYTQTSTGTFLTTLVGDSASSLLAVGGQTQLNGTLVASSLSGVPAYLGEQFTIITSALGVSGQFSSFVNLNPTGTLLTLEVIYLANSVVLEYVQGSFQIPDLTPNQSAVAGGLNQLASDHPNSRLIRALDQESLSRLPGIYDDISPVDLAAIFDVGISAAQQVAGNIERRLEDLRDNTFTESHGAYNFDAKDGKHIIDKNGKDIADETVDHRWGFYGTGIGEWADIDSTWNARGSDFTTTGFNFGGDYRLSDHLIIGLTAGYSDTTTDGYGDGKIGIDSGNANAYATWYSNGFFVNGMFGGSYSSYQIRRQSYGGDTHGDSEGTGYTGLIGTGYEYHACGWTVGPIASAQYTAIDLDSFTEHGSLAPLHVNSQGETSFQSRVGARASRAWNLCNMTLTPEVRAQWQHEYQSTAHGIGSSFAEDSAAAFTVWGPEKGRDSLLLDVGTSVRMGECTTLFAYYTLNAFATNYTTHAVSGGVRFSF